MWWCRWIIVMWNRSEGALGLLSMRSLIPVAPSLSPNPSPPPNPKPMPLHPPPPTAIPLTKRIPLHSIPHPSTTGIRPRRQPAPALRAGVQPRPLQEPARQVRGGRLGVAVYVGDGGRWWLFRCCCKWWLFRCCCICVDMCGVDRLCIVWASHVYNPPAHPHPPNPTH